MTLETLTLNNGVVLPALGYGVYQTPPAETVDAVGEALRVGYRHIDTAAAYGNEREVGRAIHASGIPRDEIFIETKLDSEHGIVNQAWSPIGGITFYRGGGSSTLDDPTIGAIAAAHGKSPAQVMLRWHIQEGRSAIPKSVTPHRIAENFDVFDFELSSEDIARIDALDQGVRRGPEPAAITLEAFGRPIPEA